LQEIVMRLQASLRQLGQRHIEPPSLFSARPKTLATPCRRPRCGHGDICLSYGTPALGTHGSVGSQYTPRRIKLVSAGELRNGRLSTSMNGSLILDPKSWSAW
jgi:hypothetical protein